MSTDDRKQETRFSPTYTEEGLSLFFSDMGVAWGDKKSEVVML